LAAVSGTRNADADRAGVGAEIILAGRRYMLNRLKIA
jgi:hypothetical protein